MRGLIVFIAVCTLTAAMVPTERPQTTQTTTQSTTEYCEPQTPCAWAVYHTPSKSREQYLENTYCSCKAGTTCQLIEGESSYNIFVYRCLSKPVTEPSEHPEP